MNENPFQHVQLCEKLITSVYRAEAKTVISNGMRSGNELISRNTRKSEEGGLRITRIP